MEMGVPGGGLPTCDTAPAPRVHILTVCHQSFSATQESFFLDRCLAQGCVTGDLDEGVVIIHFYSSLYNFHRLPFIHLSKCDSGLSLFCFAFLYFHGIIYCSPYATGFLPT